MLVPKKVYWQLMQLAVLLPKVWYKMLMMGENQNWRI